MSPAHVCVSPFCARVFLLVALHCMCRNPPSCHLQATWKQLHTHVHASANARACTLTHARTCAHTHKYAHMHTHTLNSCGRGPLALGHGSAQPHLRACPLYPRCPPGVPRMPLSVYLSVWSCTPLFSRVHVGLRACTQARRLYIWIFTHEFVDNLHTYTRTYVRTDLHTYIQNNMHKCTCLRL